MLRFKKRRRIKDASANLMGCVLTRRWFQQTQILIQPDPPRWGLSNSTGGNDFGRSADGQAM
ncbi:MAG: hypothetical protein AAF539_10250 [Planctomycetota bacterium]